MFGYGIVGHSSSSYYEKCADDSFYMEMTTERHGTADSQTASKHAAVSGSCVFELCDASFFRVVAVGLLRMQTVCTGRKLAYMYSVALLL